MNKTVALFASAAMVLGLAGGALAADMPKSAAPTAADTPASTDAPKTKKAHHKAHHKKTSTSSDSTSK